MLILTRNLQTRLSMALLCVSPTLAFADEPLSVPAQPSSVEFVIVAEVLPGAETAEQPIAAAELASMIEDEVLLDLNSRLIAAAPSS